MRSYLPFFVALFAISSALAAPAKRTIPYKTYLQLCDSDRLEAQFVQTLKRDRPVFEEETKKMTTVKRHALALAKEMSHSPSRSRLKESDLTFLNFEPGMIGGDEKFVGGGQVLYRVTFTIPTGEMFVINLETPELPAKLRSRADLPLDWANDSFDPHEAVIVGSQNPCRLFIANQDEEDEHPFAKTADDLASEAKFKSLLK